MRKYQVFLKIVQKNGSSTSSIIFPPFQWESHTLILLPTIDIKKAGKTLQEATRLYTRNEIYLHTSMNKEYPALYKKQLLYHDSFNFHTCELNFSYWTNLKNKSKNCFLFSRRHNPCMFIWSSTQQRFLISKDNHII